MKTKTKTKLPSLADLARGIDSHLKRFEADPTINTGDVPGKLTPYYRAGAYASGAYVNVMYLSFQGTTSLPRPLAMAYLAWLDAGNVGKHWKFQQEAAKPAATATAPATTPSPQVVEPAPALVVEPVPAPPPIVEMAKFYTPDGKIVEGRARCSVDVAIITPCFRLDALLEREGRKARPTIEIAQRVARDHDRHRDGLVMNSGRNGFFPFDFCPFCGTSLATNFPQAPIRTMDEAMEVLGEVLGDLAPKGGA